MLLIADFIHMVCFSLCLISAQDVVQQLLDCDRAAVVQKDMTGCGWSLAYNADTLTVFDTTTGRLVLKHASVKAEVASTNKDPKALQNIEKDIRENLDFISQLLHAGAATFDRTVSPSVTIEFQDLEEHGQASQLQCSVMGFYPRALNVTWLRGAEDVTGEVVQTRILPNSDGTFQTHAFVTFDPETRDVYACSVQHQGFPGGLRMDWDSQSRNFMPAGAVIGIVFGISGIVTVFAAAIVHSKRQAVSFSKNQPQRKSNRSETSVHSNTSAASASSGNAISLRPAGT
uniref:H-2 class II histocompatibility antigen, E-U alpha chain-like n=1 Tax=Pristiophorus japonicus TaxID=55135 RepID=UPI00398EDABC